MSSGPAYTYTSAAELAQTWRQQCGQPQSQGITVVDVRDDDFVGGHIRGCINVPSSQFESKLDDLVQRLADANKVVFHCSLSQQRGPKAARMYSEARQRAVEQGKLPAASQDTTAAKDGQTISVLRDGFANFGAQYKNDAQLVEGYDEEAWSYR